MAPHVKWTAQLNHVHEVSLLGSADLSFWQDRLANEGITPVDHDGRTSIMIVSAAGKFAGIQFRELSVSVIVASTANSAETPCYFLCRAFNSNRFFAFCERYFFSTPYTYADVGSVHHIPMAISVTQHGRTSFHAAMDRTGEPTARTPTQEREEAWMAQVILPSNGRSARGQRKMFFARIDGITQVYPFTAGKDTVAIHPQEDGDIFHALSESSYVPEEWIVRSNASHAKSKTYLWDDITKLERLKVGEPSHPPEPAAGPISNGTSSPPAQ